jgi:hypothetical protein
MKPDNLYKDIVTQVTKKKVQLHLFLNTMPCRPTGDMKVQIQAIGKFQD